MSNPNTNFMKNFKNISKGLLAKISAVGIVSVMLSSCLKDHTTNTVSQPISLVSVIQASPDQPLLDFYLDGIKVNTTSINFTDDIDYFKVVSGKRSVQFKTGSTSVALDTVNLTSNTAYSLFLVNKVSSPSFLLLTDSLTTPSGGNAGLRFVNLSPDAPSVDLAIKGGAVLVNNKGFRGFSSFNPLPGKTYSFEIRQAGTTTVLATLDNVNIYGGYVYTIWVHGLANSTGTADKLAASLIINAYPY
jgi:hypothetical protein